MKKVLIVVALAGFVKSFLMKDIFYFQNKGYEVHVAANKHHARAERIVDYFNDNGIVFHQIDFSSHSILSFSNIKSFFQIKSLAKKNNFELVHVHMAVSGFITRFALKGFYKKGLKIIYTTHGFHFSKNIVSKKDKFFYRLEKKASKFCNMIITINEEDYQNALSFKTCPIKKIHGVGVDFKKLDVASFDVNDYRKKIDIAVGKKIILSIGELSVRKNHIQVLEALKMINRDDIVYCICGIDLLNSGVKEKLEWYAKKNNIDLRLLGYRNDIPYLCRIADIGILPSKKEGLCFAGVEMIYCGLPLIGSNVGGVTDYISSENGLKYELNDTNGLAKCIVQLLDNPLKVNSTSVMIYSKENSFKEMSLIYNELLGDE